MDLRRFVHTFALAIIFIVLFPNAEAYDPLDPDGNITIKWDVMQWTPDGYVAEVTISNYQLCRPILSPGWNLAWTWTKGEFIWSMFGAEAIQQGEAEATDQGDCSKFKTIAPHSCQRNPSIVDLPPTVPYNQKIANCCKGGVLSPWGQDPSTAVSTFQLSVGNAGNTNRTVVLPKNFTLLPRERGYTCGRAKLIRPSIFLSSDGRRITQALMTWRVACQYSSFPTRKLPSNDTENPNSYICHSRVIAPIPAASAPLAAPLAAPPAIPPAASLATGWTDRVIVKRTALAATFLALALA